MNLLALLSIFAQAACLSCFCCMGCTALLWEQARLGVHCTVRFVSALLVPPSSRAGLGILPATFAAADTLSTCVFDSVLQDKFDVSKYLDAFINGPLGENRFSWMLQCLCLLAGVEPRANHALRRTFIQACYRAGMPEAAIMRYTRHQSIEGLRCYAR